MGVWSPMGSSPLPLRPPQTEGLLRRGANQMGGFCVTRLSFQRREGDKVDHPVSLTVALNLAGNEGDIIASLWPRAR